MVKDVTFYVVMGLAILVMLIAGGRNAVRDEMGIAEEVAEVRNAVVHIEKSGECQGSGCIISPDGIVFTAKHVTDGGGEFVITMDDGRKFEADLCIEVKDYDVSFLKIRTDEPLPFAPLADLSQMRVGDALFIMGSPFGYQNFNSVSLGILSAMQRDLDAKRDYGYGWAVTFQSDATAEPGNSGGPVFNMDGDVIGVLVAGMDATVNYSVPVNTFSTDIETIRQWFELAKFEVCEPLADGWDMTEDEWYAYLEAHPEARY